MTEWNPKYTLEEGLEITIEFLKQNINRYKTDIYNI